MNEALNAYEPGKTHVRRDFAGKLWLEEANGNSKGSGPKRITRAVPKRGERGRRKRIGTYEDKIDWLAARGVLTSDEAQRWHGYRDPRNEASHPEFQAMHMPGDARFWLALTARRIEHLVGV
jgi:hypothetical protein